MRCGFEGMAAVLPEHSATVDEVLAQAGLIGDTAMRSAILNNGLRQVRIWDGSTASILYTALSRLADQVEGLVERVRLVIYGHSLTVAAELTEAMDACGLALVPRLTLGGQPCAILHQAVKLAAEWAADLPTGQGVVVVGADRPETANDRVFFNSVMGDGAFAAFVAKGGDAHRLLASEVHTELIAAHGERSSDDAIARFRAANPLLIRRCMEACLARAGVLGFDLVAHVFPHTPNTKIWDLVAETARVPRQRIHSDAVAETGHINSNDSFIHYARACQAGLVVPGELSLLINPGFGGTQGCTLLRR
jgi:3-oxoacyl-[acyl-carrier-protein] synthase-3